MAHSAAHTEHTALPITDEEWIRCWLNIWGDEDWRFGFTDMVLVGDLETVYKEERDWSYPMWGEKVLVRDEEKSRGPWMVEWHPKPGVLIVDGVEQSSPEWL